MKTINNKDYVMGPQRLPYGLLPQIIEYCIRT